jgi:hypothetical protein
VHCAFAEEEEGHDGWKLNHGNAYAETLHVSRDFTSGTELVDEFYQEEKQYRYDSKEYNPLTGMHCSKHDYYECRIMGVTEIY